MSPDLNAGFGAIAGLFVVLYVGMAIGLVVAIFLIAGATRRTARATEFLAREIGEIKAYLTSKAE